MYIVLLFGKQQILCLMKSSTQDLSAFTEFVATLIEAKGGGTHLRLFGVVVV